jgi:hypothetical protein
MIVDVARRQQRIVPFTSILMRRTAKRKRPLRNERVTTLACSLADFSIEKDAYCLVMYLGNP